MNMGDKIKQRRTELKMTQEELAEKLNVSRSSVANWEAGRNYPDLQLIAAIADILGLSLDELLREDCEMIKRIAEDTKCRKKQSWKIRVLSILLAGVLVAASIIGIKFLPVSMDVESVRIYKAIVDIESGSNISMTGPSPTKEKLFAYDNYNLGLHFIKKDDVEIGLEYQTTRTAREDCMLDWSAEQIVPEKSKTVAGEETYKINCSWDTDNDGKLDMYAIVTGIDAGYGIYIINTYGMGEDDVAVVNKKHNKILKSFDLVENADSSGATADIGELGDYIFSLPGWDTCQINNKEQIVIYASQRDMDYLITAKSVDKLDITEDSMIDIMNDLHGYSLDDVALINQKAPIKTKVGSAVWAGFHISYDGGSRDKSALFVLNKEGKIVACFTNDYDDDLSEDYSEIVDSIQYKETYSKQLADLWEGRISQLDSLEDHKKALELVSEVGFGEFGYSYNTEFTEGDGIKITYKTPATKSDFTREGALLLATIEPLEYVEVVYNDNESHIVKSDNVEYGVNIKRIGRERDLFERYFWETLQL